MSTFNIKRKLSKIAVTLGVFVAAFCVLAFGANNIKAANVTNATITDIYDEQGGNYNVYIPKEVPDNGDLTAGTPATCADSYWNVGCNTRTAINTKNFTFFVMVPHAYDTGNNEQVWDSSITYFQYAVVYAGDSPVNPFWSESAGHLDSTLYPLGVPQDGSGWFNMSVAGNGGMQVSYNSAYGAIDAEGDYMIYIRYRLQGSDEVAVAEGSFGYYTNLTNLNATTIARAVSGATNKGYNLTATFTSAVNNDPDIERIAWMEGTKSVSDFTSNFLYTSDSDYTTFDPTKTTSSFAISKNVTYTFYIQDRAGNRVVKTHTVDNIFASVSVTVNGNLNQNVGSTVIYVDANRTVVATASGNTAYYGLANVVLTAVVKDSSGNSAAKSYISWTISTTSKGKTNSLTGLNGEYDYTWTKSDGVYGKWVITAKAGSLDIGSKTITVVPILTVTPTTDKASYVYGELPTIDYTYSGWAKASTGSANDDSTIVGNKNNTYNWATMKNKGSHSFAATGFSTTYDEYVFDYKTVSYSITQKALTVTYKGGSKTYDGAYYNPNATSWADITSKYTVSGLEYGETLATLTTEYTNQQIKDVKAGNYTIVSKTLTINTASVHPTTSVDANNAHLDNYAITQNSGTYIIYPIKVHAVFKKQTLEYKQAQFESSIFTTPGNYTITYKDNSDVAVSMPTGESISAFAYKIGYGNPKTYTNDYRPETVGTYYVQARALTISGGSATNYSLTSADGEFIISKKILTVKFNNDSTSYDGTSYTDDLAALDNYTFNVTATQLAEWKQKSGAAVVFNIKFACHTNVNGTCNPITTATAPTANDLKYAGVYTIIPVSVSNVPDSISTNYDLNINATNGTFTINRISLSIAYRAASKTYDGVSVSFGTQNLYTFTGLVSADPQSGVTKVTYTIDGSSTTQSVVNAGTYLIAPVDAEFTARDSYTISGNTSANYVINKRSATIEYIVKPAVTYDNQVYSFSSIDLYEISNFVSGQGPTLIDYDVKNAGGSTVSKVVDVGGYTITPLASSTFGTGFSHSNYDIDYVGGLFTINKRTITLTVTDKELLFKNSTYTFSDPTLYTIGGDGMAENEEIDTVAYSVKNKAGTQTATPLNVGEYNVIPSSFTVKGTPNGSAGFANYNLTGNTTLIEIVTVKIDIATCTAEPLSKVYDGTTSLPRAFTMTCSGQDGNVASVDVTPGSGSGYDVADVSAKTITILAATLGNSNFEWKNNVATRTYNATITARPINLSDMTAKSNTSFKKQYDATTTASLNVYYLDYSAVSPDLDDDYGIVGTDDLGLSFAANYESANVCKTVDPTNCTKTSVIKVTGAKITNSNYSLVGTSRDDDVGEITPKPATITVNDIADITYGQVATITFSYSGFVDNQNATAFEGLTSSYKNTANGDVHRNVVASGHTIDPVYTYVKYGNYTVTDVPGTVMVTPFNISITYSQNGKDIYDAQSRNKATLFEAASNYIVDPETLPYSERLDGVLTYDLKYKEIGQGDDKYVAATDVMKAGIYKVTVSTFKIAGGNALASNYKLNTTSGTHQIDPITLIITFNSAYAGSTVSYADKNYDTDLNDKKFYTTNLLLETERTAWNNASLSITYSAVRYIGEAAQTDRYVRNYGVYKITPTGINGTVPADIYNNYNVANMTTDHYKVGNFTINKVDVTVSFNSGQTSVYDGRSRDFTDYSATNYTVATMVGNDLASLTKVSYDVVYPSGKTKIKDAGTYKISPKDVTITADPTYGDIKQNYAFTYTKETSYVISPLAITMETVTNTFFTIGGSKERVFDDTTNADNLTITYIPQITNEDGVEENATYIGLSFSKAYNKKNVSEATSIIVSNIKVTDANYTISPTSLTFTGCKLTPITNARIITLLNGVQTTNTYTYGTEAVVTFLYEGFYSEGKVLATNSTTDQTKAAAQVTGLVHEYYPSTTTTLRNVGTHPVVGKSASNTYGNYTFASANYVKADVVVEAMDVTITYKGNESIYNATAVSTDFFTKPEYYTIVGEDPFTTNNVLPYSESVSAISNYKINNVEKGTVLSVGKYTVAATEITIAGGNALASNYNVVAVTNEKTIYEVTKQPIVFKFDDDTYAYKAGEYDLSDIDLYTLTNMSDMPSSDQEKIWDLASGGATVEYTVSRKVGDTSKPDTDVINYGVYTITITNINNLDQDIIDNYKITYTTGTLTITQHTVTVTFVTANKIYDGVAVNLSNPNLYTIKVGETANAAGVVSLIGADKLSSIAYTPTTEIKRANTYPITATGMTVSSLYESANYIFKAGTAVNYVINQRELVLADFVVTNDLIKTYDGNTSTDVTLAPNAKSGDKGLISGDNAQFTYDIAYESKNALGTGNSVIKVTNAAVANTDYKISGETRDLTGATINKATLDLSEQNIYSKDFDNNTTMFATEDVEVTTGINSGSGIETLYISWSDITDAFADVKYGENKVVTISALTLEDGNNGGLASNYEFVAMSKALATINGITYDISGTTCSINVNYKTYDGNTNAMGIGFKITCSGAKYHVDDFELSYTSATFESKDAKGIKATNNITAAGFDFVNATYKNDYGFELSALTRSFAGYINPLTLDIADFTESAASTFTKVYDGNTNSNVVLTPTGFVGTDDVKYTQTAKYDNANAGSNKDITISGTLANYNYCFSNSTGETPVYTDQIVLKGTITQKGLTIRVMLDTKDINTDVPLNELTVEYGTAIVVSYDYIDGFITGEDVSALDITGLTNTYNASTMKNVNTSTGYTVSASGATAVNYSISYQSAKLKITPFLVTLTPLARTIHYDLSTVVDMKTVGTAYSLDRTLPYSEKLAGELETENFDKFLYNSTYKRHVGTYLVLQGGITNTNNTNYTITYSSEEVYLTVNDTIKPIINNVTVVDSKGGTYTEGTTATSGLKFTVDASDEAFTLDANAYNLKVTLTICAGNDKSCAEVVTAEKTFATIATTKDADGINTFTANDTARNGTFTYVFKVYDSQSNVVATPSYVLVRYLAPEFDKITESATQQNVAFTITGYDSFLNGRTASWKYFFSRTITEPTEKDFGYHGVELSDKSGSSYTEFGVSSGTLRASAKTPLGLKGNYKMLLELKIDEETIYYTQPEAFTIYIATQASQAMYLSSSYSLGNGSTYDGVMTDNGNTLAVINSGNNGPTLMSYGNDNGQMVTKFDDLGNIIWSIDFGAYGIHADKVIDDGEQTIVLGSAKVVNLAQIGEKHNFNDREVVIVRIDENGQIIGFNFVEHNGVDKGVAIAVHDNKYVIVVDTEDGVLVNMYDDGNLVWSREITGEFDINDIDFDEEVVALVGEANTPEYYVDGKRYIVANRGNGDALIITFDFDGILKQIRTLGSSLHEEYVQVSVFGSYIYVLGNTEATMLYNSYGASLISTAKDGYEGFVALYKKRDIKIYRATFIGGDGDEIHTSMNVNEHGFTVVGTTTSKEELKVSGVSGNYITLPDYVGTLTLVYEYDTNMLLNSIGYFQGTDISISDIGYDLDGKLMLMSTGSSLSLMVERKFDLEDIVLSVKGKKGYVSIVGDHSEIVVTKDGNVIGNSNEFIVDSNGIYSVTVTDNYGRMVTKSINVTSFIDGSAAVKTSQNSAIYSLILVSVVIVLGDCLSAIIASKKNKKEEV